MGIDCAPDPIVNTPGLPVGGHLLQKRRLISLVVALSQVLFEIVYPEEFPEGVQSVPIRVGLELQDEHLESRSPVLIPVCGH